uniref:G-protein coupled receptors family 1 profile domain-containing protein n=1 Tax=Globodera rostochiensis TaxID=31243 RepID=A0A914GRY7_GLORO
MPRSSVTKCSPQPVGSHSALVAKCVYLYTHSVCKKLGIFLSDTLPNCALRFSVLNESAGLTGPKGPEIFVNGTARKKGLMRGHAAPKVLSNQIDLCQIFSACLAKRHNSGHALSNIDELLPFQNGQRHVQASVQQHSNGVLLLQPINSLQKQKLLQHSKPLSSGAQMVLLNLFNLQTKMLNMTTSVAGNDDGHLLEQFNASPTVAQTVFMPPATTVVQLADTVPEHLMMTIHEQHQHLPSFELILGTLTYLVIIGITILGNTLVILAVFSYRPLKKVQNYFIVSLAASDMLVALLVMPLHVVKFLANGQWLLGVAVCQLFTTADILLCTSSILNLCAIAIDRYWAIHDPIAYAQKRSLKLVGGMIVLVWVASAVISVPPLIGWNDWTSQQLVDHCELTSEKAFVVFSASGSFFLPLLVMVIVYVKIFLNARKRIRKNRGRSALFKMSSELADQKHKRSHRIPVAATSVIALASATGAHIFRKRTLRKSSAETRSGSVTEAGGGACRLAECAAVSSLMTTAYCSVQQQPLHVPKMPGYHGIRREEEMDGDSGHGGSSKDSPENTVAIPPPPAPSVPARLYQSPHMPVIKRHSLTPAAAAVAAPSMVALTSSASLMAIASGEKPPPLLPAAMENGAATAMKMTSPETVELKTHLKEREKISVAKEKRAAKTIAVIIFVFTFCWLPFFCAYVVMPFCSNCYLHPKVHQAFVWLGYINSSLNPFLYGILNLEFRRAFRKILCPKRVQNAQRRRLSEQLSVRKKSAPKT